MHRSLLIGLVALVAAAGCSAQPRPEAKVPPPDPPTAAPPDSTPATPRAAATVEARPAEARRAAGEALDAWHAAAARADETTYFDLFDDAGVFLGTDATERWDEKAFRAYAKPFFAKGRAWTFRSTRRELVLSPDGSLAWFDEDLDAPRLGPVRGSGVLVRRAEGWRVLHYVLSITVPNDRFDAVKEAVAAPAEPAPEKRRD